MLSILADVLLIATGQRQNRPSVPEDRWADRFPPPCPPERHRPGYGWFNPGPDRHW